MHLDKHFRGGHVQFTCFNDITNLLELYGAEIDWNDFITTCRLHKCEHAVMEYIVMVNEYMHVGLSEAIVEKYKTLLTEDDEFLFIQYLNGNTQQIKPFSAVPAHLENLKNLNVKDRSRYLLDLLFPPKGFMISKYGHQFTIRNTIRNSQFIIHNSNTKIHNSQFIIHKIRVPWWFLYPYRWGVGVKGVMKIIRRNP